VTLFPDEEIARAAPAGPLVRVRMVVAYDGRPFAGFARQAGARTVQGELEAVLTRVLRHPVTVAGAGRTDRGVHAWGQVVSFDAAAAGFDPAAVRRAVNRLLGPRIVARSVTVAPPTFHARHSALARHYRYLVLNTPVPNPFLAHAAWHVPEPLDLAPMRLGCDPLIGEHDFSSFCRRPKGAPELRMVRRVIDARWHACGDGLLRFEISATSFCHQMVRSIVGLLVDVGRGRRRAGEVAGILRARDRRAATTVAPPHGLYLWQVDYPPDEALGAAPSGSGPGD
jgi:tRNA pseudouridine38-40 synthase